MSSAQDGVGSISGGGPFPAGEAALPKEDGEPWLQPFRGPLQRWPRTTDTLLAALAFLLTLAMWSVNGKAADLGAAVSGGLLLIALVASAALIWRRSHPVVVHAVILCCLLATTLGPLNDGVVAMAFSLYSLGRYAGDGRVSLLGMLLALLVASTDLFVMNAAGPGGLFTLLMMGTVWYVGRRLRFRGEYLRLLEERARDLEQRRNEAAELAVAEERGRIARELHDIVAHQLSLMTVQAGAAKTVAQSNPGAALEAMAAVEAAGRQALREMRHLLHVLRREESGGGLAPQPGCVDLPSLVSEVSAAGAAVELRTHGRLSGLPPRVDLAVYRIVQEALTNVLKHAGECAAVTVTVTAAAGGVELMICDTGRGPAATTGQGYGISGMRERAELLGGWLRAGPGADGGFEVCAMLPYGDGRP